MHILASYYPLSDDFNLLAASVRDSLYPSLLLMSMFTVYSNETYCFHMAYNLKAKSFRYHRWKYQKQYMVVTIV
jgi:hypothetical protein